MEKQIILIIGYPASGKTSLAKEYVNMGYYRLNRDELGGSLASLNKRLEELIVTGTTEFVMDNTYPTIESRRPIIELGEKYNIPVKCIHLKTSIENAQYNSILRIIKESGKLLSPREIAKSKNSDIIPAAAIFNHRRKFEKPTDEEGFEEITNKRFTRRYNDSLVNKAVFFDFNSIRKTKSGRQYPIDRNDIEIIPGRQAGLSDLKAQGYKLIGISNQSAIGKDMFTSADAKALFEFTNELMGGIIDDFDFCPHNSYPIQCYCRKPMPGFGVQFIEKYKLNPSECLMIITEKADETFAKRCGFQQFGGEEFFEDYESFELENSTSNQ